MKDISALTVLQLLALLLLSVLHETHGKHNADEGKAFEGDIDLSNKGEVTFVSNDTIVIEPAKTWPNKTIPYEISSEFSTDQRGVILGSMQEIMVDTCVVFTPRKEEQDYIFIQLGRTCVSHVGVKGGKQTVTLKFSGVPSSNCVNHGEVLHELLHAVGLWHEQSRPDRDKFVKIEKENLSRRANRRNFKKHLGMRNYHLPYDYSSIMHYSRDAFQRHRAAITVIAKVGGAPIGLRFHMSHFDKVKVNRLYRCDAFH